MKDTTNTKSRYLAFLRRNGAAVILTAGLFILFYAVVFNFSQYGPASDYFAHIFWAVTMSKQDILSSFYNGSERLWHILVKCVYTLFTHNTWSAAAIVTASADAAAYFLLFKIWDRALPEKLPRWLLAAVTACVFLVSSLTLPGHTFYVGRSAVNTWHNPTNIMVRPFAIAVFYMTVNIYNRRRYDLHSALVSPAEAGKDFAFSGGFWAQFRVRVYSKAELVLYPVCILLSTYAKPSFLQFFAPAILVFCLIDVLRTKGRLFPFCVKLALSFLPAALILSKQFFNYFDANISIATAAAAAAETASSTDGGVAVYFIQPVFSSLGEFARVTADAVFSVLYPCAFPLFVLLAAPRRGVQSAAGRLSWICVIAALLESWLLHETGIRATHGNFLWGYYLSTLILWTASIGQYAALIQEKTLSGRLARWGGTAFLLWHLTCGVCYVIRILQTCDYYF